MNLPHGKILTFAKALVEYSENTILVRCKFPISPTLPMFIEAGAQACVGFKKDNQVHLGFVSMVKNVIQLKSLNAQEYMFKIQKQIESNDYLQVTFEAYNIDENTLVVSGELTLVLKK
jgi:hypothetical protein